MLTNADKEISRPVGRIEPKLNQVVPWSLPTFPENNVEQFFRDAV